MLTKDSDFLNFVMVTTSVIPQVKIMGRVVRGGKKWLPSWVDLENVNKLISSLPQKKIAPQMLNFPCKPLDKSTKQISSSSWLMIYRTN